MLEWTPYPPAVPMGELHLDCITSPDDLRAQAGVWDDLWERSHVSLPTARAEAVALWLEHFAPRSRFAGLMVTEGGRAVAAMPLVGRRVKRVFPAADLTWNSWSTNGELLVDPSAASDDAMDRLVGALGDLPWPLLWFELAPIRTRRWQALAAATMRNGLASETRARYWIGTVSVRGDLHEYLASRSRGLRKSTRAKLRRLGRLGCVRLRRLDRLAPEDVGPWLDRAWEIEDRGWKGTSGSSVLRTPGQSGFYRRQAEWLARCGLLRLSFLELDRRPIAFVVGCQGKDVHHCQKIGFDPDLARYSPGQLLWSLLIESLEEDRSCRVLDFQGPLTQSLRSWATHGYVIGRLVVPTRPAGRLLLTGYRLAGRLARSPHPCRTERFNEPHPSPIVEGSPSECPAHEVLPDAGI